MTQIIFITTIPSPFWIEFAAAYEQLTLSSFVILNRHHSSPSRNKYWNIPDANKFLKYCPSSKSVFKTISRIIAAKPDSVVILGGVYSPANIITAFYLQSRNIEYGYFAEMPTPKNYYWNNLRSIFLKLLSLFLHPSFFLACGYRSLDYYNQIFGKKLYSINFPYSQDLEANHYQTAKLCDSKSCVKFLFSGQYIERNLIFQILNASEELAKIYGVTAFKLILSGYGPLASAVHNRVDSNHYLDQIVVYAENHLTWSDRMTPYHQADILLSPYSHSGWGLIIPEALSSGLPIITTTNTEASRQYVHHMINGIFIKPSTHHIFSAMRYFMDNPSEIKNMKRNAAILLHPAHAKNAALILHQTVSFAINNKL